MASLKAQTSISKRFHDSSRDTADNAASAQATGRRNGQRLHRAPQRRTRSSRTATAATLDASRLAELTPAFSHGPANTATEASGLLEAAASLRCKSPEDLSDVLAALIMSECVYKKVEGIGHVAVAAKVSEFASAFPPGTCRGSRPRRAAGCLKAVRRQGCGCMDDACNNLSSRVYDGLLPGLRRRECAAGGCRASETRTCRVRACRPCTATPRPIHSSQPSLQTLPRLLSYKPSSCVPRTQRHPHTRRTSLRLPTPVAEPRNPLFPASSSSSPASSSSRLDPAGVAADHAVRHPAALHDRHHAHLAGGGLHGHQALGGPAGGRQPAAHARVGRVGGAGGGRGGCREAERRRSRLPQRQAAGAKAAAGASWWGSCVRSRSWPKSCSRLRHSIIAP